MKQYNQELEASSPKNILKKRFTEEEKTRFINAFIEFYKVYSTDQINTYFDKIYAPDTYFRDPYKGIKGREAAKKYFLSGAEAVRSCTFEVQDAIEKNNEFYFRWIMRLKLNRYPDKHIETVGMSHVRYNSNGQIIFHQDYWDSNEVFQTFPIIGSVIRWIKNKI